MLNRKTFFSCIVLLLFLFFSNFLYAAEGLIKEVVFHEKNGNSESVVFYLNGSWLPKVFALKGDNPRVVFDFMETGLAKTIPSAILAEGDMIKKIRLARYNNKTRVVMDLTAGGAFDFDQQFDEKENILTIKLFPADLPEKNEVADIQAEPEERVTPDSAVGLKEEKDNSAIIVEEPQQKTVKAIETVEEVKAVGTVEVVAVEKLISETAGKTDPALDPLLNEVSFENTSSKGEMVLFKLNGFYPPTVSGEEEGTPLVVCDFVGTRLGNKVVKELLTNGEYIERVSVTQPKDFDSFQVIIELVPNKNYDLQQVFFKEDNLFVIIVNSYIQKEPDSIKPEDMQSDTKELSQQRLNSNK